MYLKTTEPVVSVAQLVLSYLFLVFFQCRILYPNMIVAYWKCLRRMGIGYAFFLVIFLLCVLQIINSHWCALGR